MARNRLAEHQGHTLAEKLAPGPKATRAAATTPPPSRSGGNSGNLSIPGYTPSTPIGAPYSPTEPGHAEQDFSRAFAPKTRHVDDILDALDDLAGPLLGGRTVAQTAKAALNLGVEPLAAQAAVTPKGITPEQTLASVVGGALGHLAAGTQSPKIASPSAQELLKQIPVVGTKGSPLVGPGVKDGGVFYVNPATVSNPKVARHNNRIYSEVIGDGKTLKPSGLPGSTEGARANQPHNRQDPLGAKTLGNATAVELAQALKEGKLKISPKGVISTPQVRSAAANLAKVRQAIAASASGGQLPELGPEESEIARKVLAVGKEMGATKLDLISAIDAGLQETDFKNLKPYENSYNENTAGWREELAPYFTDRLNVKKSAENFFNEIGTKGSESETPGNLAQTVQGSAYGGEETYGTHTPQAQAILAAYNQQKLTPQLKQHLAAAEGQAREVGLDPKVVGGGAASTLGPVAPQIMARFQAGLTAAKQLNSLGDPYSWAGGHDVSFKPGGEGENGGAGYDCSGAVSYVLHAMGILKSPVTSGDMGSVKGLAPGPGAITVYWNGVHTFMKIGKRFFGTSNDNPGGGAGFFTSQTGESEAQGGNSGGAFNVSHVVGLGKKVALQLGIKPGELTGGSGVTYSEGGSVATVNPGSGETVTGAAKYSAKPISAEGRPVTIGEVPVDEILTPGRQILSPEEEGIIQRLIAGRRA